MTHQAVTQSPHPPGHQPGHVLGGSPHTEVQAVTHQNVTQPPGQQQGQVLKGQLYQPGVQAMTYHTVPHQPGRVLGEQQDLGVQAFTHQALTQPPDHQQGWVLGELHYAEVKAVTHHQDAPQPPGY